VDDLGSGEVVGGHVGAQHVEAVERGLRGDLVLLAAVGEAVASRAAVAELAEQQKSHSRLLSGDHSLSK